MNKLLIDSNISRGLRFYAYTNSENRSDNSKKKNVYRNSLSIDSLYFTEVMYKNTEEMSICET